MVTESTISPSHQRSSCYVVPIIDHRTATHAGLPLELSLATLDDVFGLFLAISIYTLAVAWPPFPMKSRMTVYHDW